MKLSINFKNSDSHGDIEAEIDRHSRKLQKLLKTYAPDLVQLHAAFGKNPHMEEQTCTLNLSLPTGNMHATAAGATVRTSCKKAFAELDEQVKKHQSRLRKDYEWKRKRPRVRAEAGG